MRTDAVSRRHCVATLCLLLLSILTPFGLAQDLKFEGTAPLQVFEEFKSVVPPRSSKCDEPIETDRHDFTQSVKTVGKGTVQFEYGYLYFYKDNSEEIEHTHVTPELVMRYGLTDRSEIKIRWNYAWRFFDAEDGDDLDSAEDLRLEFKLETSEADQWIPDSAFAFRMTVPAGGSAWTTDAVEVGAFLIYAWELDKEMKLVGSTGFATNGAGDVAFGNSELGQADDFIVWFQSAGVEFPIAHRVTGFFEYFGVFSYALADNVVLNYLNAGFDLLITNDMLIDFRIGKGLSNDADDLFVGAGGAIRF